MKIRLALVAIVLFGVLAPIGWYVSGNLERWTGETELRFQAISLLSSFDDPALSLADEAAINSDTVPYGVNVFLEQEVEEWKLRKSFDLMKAAGVRWIRQQVPWKDIEVNGKGDFSNEYGSTWAKYDRFFDMANEYGIQVMARLDGPPDWTREDNRVYNRPPDNLADYGDFVAAFAGRYKGKVDTYQIWNEPNIFPEWGWREADAAGYAELLKVAADRARAANPNAVIVAAALAPTDGTPDGYNENDLLYLQKLYDAGAADSFDVMSAMGYSPWTGPQDRRTERTRVNFSRVKLIRDVMVRNGDETKPLWIAELGWNALPAGYDKPATHGRVTREQQARYVADAYQRAQDEWPWVGVIFIWNFRLVHDENRDQTPYYFGLADADFTLHPSYFAYQDIATRKTVLTPGRKSESHPAISVNGPWTYVEGTGAAGYFLRSTTPGDAIAFEARGTEIALRVRRGPGLGTIRVLVDNKPAPTLLDGRMTLSLRDSTWEDVVLARDLSDGVHRVDVVNEAGTVDFDGVLVRRPTDGAGPAALTIGTILVSLLGLGWFAAGLVVRRYEGLVPVRLPRRSSIGVRLPVELFRELAADIPKERRAAFIAGAVAEALRRRREPSKAPDAEPTPSGERR